ncbi:MAG: trypsin-like serine protease, partial [bacterium]
PVFTDWPTRGTDALITGWGSTGSWGERPTHLRKATVQVIASPTKPRCEEYPRGNYVPALMLCAGIPRTGGIGTCQGDSGGPLAVTVNGIPYLAGVTSFGRGCAEPGYPGVFARVTSYTSWIARTQRTPPGSLRVSTTTRLPRDADFCVRVFNADTRSDAPIGGACAAAGRRTVTIPDLMPGRYEIVTDDGQEGAGSVVPTWWSPRGPQADRSRAGAVIVRSAEQSDVQATVVVGNAIAVEVSPDAYDRDPRSRTCLSAYAVGFDSQAATTCSPMRFSAGRFVYFLIGLPASRYDVRARDRGGIYRTQWYPGVPLKAQAISVPVATREVTHVAMDVSRFTTRPGPVGNLRATVSPGPGSGSRARITWDYPLKSGGLEVTEYSVVITRGRTQVGSTRVIADTELSIPYLLPGTYVATVRAVNRLGPGRAARVTFPVSRPSAV